MSYIDIAQISDSFSSFFRKKNAEETKARTSVILWGKYRRYSNTSNENPPICRWMSKSKRRIRKYTRWTKHNVCSHTIAAVFRERTAAATPTTVPRQKIREFQGVFGPIVFWFFSKWPERPHLPTGNPPRVNWWVLGHSSPNLELQHCWFNVLGAFPHVTDRFVPKPHALPEIPTTSTSEPVC